MSETKPDRCPTCGNERHYRDELCRNTFHDAPKPETQADAERIRALETENASLLKRAKLLEDKWRQMEAYGFISPSVVLERIEAIRLERDALLKRAEAAEHLHDKCCKDKVGAFCVPPWRQGR
jgi:hypothetical protein